MRQKCFLLLLVLGMPAASLCQSNSSDSQTMQALLTEVRELRRDLQSSLAKVQSTQILLSRLQVQQAAATRASERLMEARSTLADAQAHRKRLAADIKRMEDALSGEQNLAEEKRLREAINHAKFELEDATDLEQHQVAEIDAAQQLRTEQDKLSVLEDQLDTLVRGLSNSGHTR